MKNKIFLLLAGAFILRIILAFGVWHPDVNNHMDWGIRFFQYQARGFFAPESNVWNFTWPNQPPGTIYLYAAIRVLYEFIFGLFWWLNVNISVFPSTLIPFFERSLYPALLKLPAILADFGIAYLLYKILCQAKKRKAGVVAASMFLLNPAIWYNSAVWGQTDSVIGFFALLSFYLLLSRKLVFAILAFAVCIYIKISLLIFVPIFILYAIRQRYILRQWIVGILLAVATIWVLTIPFSGINALPWLYNLYTERVLTNQLQVITANAFNIWAFLTGLAEQPHTLMLGFLSYQAWGIILFLLVSVPTLYMLWKTNTKTALWWSLALVSFASFILMTNMHERYLYPLFPYLTLLAAQKKEIRPYYWLISIINLINLYHLWWVPKNDMAISLLNIGNHMLPRILGLLNTLMLVALILVLIRRKKHILT